MTKHILFFYRKYNVTDTDNIQNDKTISVNCHKKTHTDKK